MRKIILILTTIVMAFALTGCFGPKGYNEVSYNDLTKMLNEKEDFILLIGAESCSACKAFRPTMERVIKDYKIDVKYIDNDRLSTSEKSELLSRFYITGTPTTIFIEDGVEKEDSKRIDGNQKYSKVVKILKDEGYIKE